MTTANTKLFNNSNMDASNKSESGYSNDLTEKRTLLLCDLPIPTQ